MLPRGCNLSGEIMQFQYIYISAATQLQYCRLVIVVPYLISFNLSVFITLGTFPVHNSIFHFYPFFKEMFRKEYHIHSEIVFKFKFKLYSNLNFFFLRIV